MAEASEPVKAVVACRGAGGVWFGGCLETKRQCGTWAWQRRRAAMLPGWSWMCVWWRESRQAARRGVQGPGPRSPGLMCERIIGIFPRAASKVVLLPCRPARGREVSCTQSRQSCTQLLVAHRGRQGSSRDAGGRPTGRMSFRVFAVLDLSPTPSVIGRRQRPHDDPRSTLQDGIYPCPPSVKCLAPASRLPSSIVGFQLGLVSVIDTATTATAGHSAWLTNSAPPVSKHHHPSRLRPHLSAI